MFHQIMNAKLYFRVCLEIVVGSSDKPIYPDPLSLQAQVPIIMWLADGNSLMCYNEIQAGLTEEHPEMFLTFS